MDNPVGLHATLTDAGGMQPLYLPTVSTSWSEAVCSFIVYFWILSSNFIKLVTADIFPMVCAWCCCWRQMEVERRSLVGVLPSLPLLRLVSYYDAV